MDVQKFNNSAAEFRLAAEAAKISLEQMLGKLTDGRCVTPNEASVYQQFVDAMNTHYRAVVAEAQALLPAEELPEEGSPIADYVAAYEARSSNMLQEKIRQIASVLELFVKVQSVVRSYAEAIRPYQAKAETLLDSLQEPSLQLSTLEAPEYDTDAQALFLQCVRQCADDSDETLEEREALLDRVHVLFPERRIYDGLISGRYYIADDHIVKHTVSAAGPTSEQAADSTPSVPAEAADIPAESAPAPETQPENGSAADTGIPAETDADTDKQDAPAEISDEAAASAESADSETDTADNWESVGISDPSALCITAEPEHLKTEVSPKAAAPFGVKALKQEFRKYNGLIMPAIRNAANFGFVTPELLETEMPRSWNYETRERSCKIAYQLGYLNYNQGPDGTAFYSLSSRGKQIFRHPDAAKLFDITAGEYKDRWFEYEGIPSVEMLRLILVRNTHRYLKDQKTVSRFDMFPYYYGNSFGCWLKKYFEDQRDLLVFCVISDTPAGFREVLDLVDEKDHDKWGILMIGVSREHAAALTEWFRSAVPEFHDKTDMFYLDDTTGAIYARSGERITDLAAYPLQADSPAAKQPEAQSAAPETEPAVPDEPVAEDAAQDTPEPAEESDAAVTNAAAEEAAPEDTAEENAAEAAPETAGDTAEIGAAPAYGPGQENFEELTDTQRKKHTELCMQMLASGKQYCATAFAWVLAERYPEMEYYYKQLAYAYNDPLAKCQYNSDMIFDTFFTQMTPISDHLVIAAVLRNYFYDQWPFDYSIPQLQDAISSNPLLAQNSALQDTIYRLKEFKIQFHHGIDYCADYRQKERKKLEDSLRVISTEASRLYEGYIVSYAKESVQQKRFLETKKILFDQKSDLAACLEYVMNDERESIELIEDYLRNSVIREGCVIAEYNIDQEKLNALIVKAWTDAGKVVRLEKKSSDLMGKLHNNLFKGVEKITQLLCRYVMLLEGCAASENSAEQLEYAQIRDPLLKRIESAIDHFEYSYDGTLSGSCGKQVICDTLAELHARLDGTYDEESHRYFYIDFLRSEWILLNEDNLPVFDEVFELPELSILARIERHFSEPDQSFETRLQSIMEGGDDYGSAKLIVQYLKRFAPESPSASLTAESIRDAAEYAGTDIENKRKDFMEDLELRHAYGQIDNTKIDMKESFVQIMDVWYERALQDGNFGFFYKILKGIQEKIKKNAQSRAKSLLQDIGSYITEHKGAEADEKIGSVISQIRERIETQNYAAAEDLLNRLQKNDLETAESLIEKDYLQDFLDNYQDYSKRAGAAGVPFRGLNVHNKDTKGGNRVLESWPTSSHLPAEQIKKLLTALGFSIGSVTAQKPIKNNNTYLVSLNQPQDGRKNTYTHPIAAFGSEAEHNGFRVVSVLGKMDATRLIDLMEQIGSAYNTMILLDYSLNLPDRRELARKAKTLHLGKTIIVADRLVAAYVARNYSDNAVNRMLMALTIPFSSCQPYVYDSAHIMPPEIFMGRKRELAEIRSPQGVHIVYGGRQLGKSALLRKAQADTDHDEQNNRAVLIDIKGKKYREAAWKISEELIDQGILEDGTPTEEWDQLARMLKKRLRDTSEGKYIPYLLLLLDEADDFIESCDEVDYKPLEALKDVESVGPERFKFVVAGLRNIIRFKNTALKKNIVMTHFSSMTVMPFRSAEARELLEIPLSYLGFRFPDDEKTETLISTIFGTTNYFPGLLQLYCAKLIESLQKNYAGYDESTAPPYVLKEEQIKKALADSTLEQQIREKFFITLKLDDDDYYFLIALLAAYHYHHNNGQNGTSAENIKELAEEFEITKLAQLSTDSIGALMEEMRELNVFQKTESKRYRFARLNFCQMMGSKDQIDNEILDYVAENGG